MSIIFHIDVNSAYLSWTATEQLKNGAAVDLREIPSIIGGDKKSRHGVVLAKSVPAKKYGIHTGEPVVNAFFKCPNLVMEPPDHRMYREYSRKLMQFLRTYTDRIEQVSVDECYMDVTDILTDDVSAVECARQIKDRVRDRFGFTVNVGISTNKLLAKMASDFEKPDKVHTLFPDEVPEKMWPLPVRELYMAGQSSVEYLKKLEIVTIGDLARADVAVLEQHMKSHGRKLWEFANGIDHSVVEPEQGEVKGIGNSTTLPRDLTTEDEAKPVLLELAGSVARRLKKAGQKAGMLSVEIKYYNFESASHQKQLNRPTAKKEQLYAEAVQLFREFWNGEPIRLLGIRSSKLVEEEAPEQLSLFDAEFQEDAKKREKKRKIQSALEKVRRKYGDDIVKKGFEE